jgi:hypothetical protein
MADSIGLDLPVVLETLAASRAARIRVARVPFSASNVLSLSSG